MARHWIPACAGMTPWLSDGSLQGSKPLIRPSAGLFPEGEVGGGPIAGAEENSGVMPEQAGIRRDASSGSELVDGPALDSRLRGNDTVVY